MLSTVQARSRGGSAARPGREIRGTAGLRTQIRRFPEAARTEVRGSLDGSVLAGIGVQI